MPEDYGKRIAFVKRHGIALWDTIGACFREGSLDMNITQEEPNDIKGLLDRYPTIKLIACNGTKSFDVFHRTIDLAEDSPVMVVKLPSSSPIPGRYTKTFLEKVDAWSIILDYI